MDKEKAYIILSYIEDVCQLLHLPCIDLRRQEAVLLVGDMARRLYAYIQASKDEDLMLACCRVDRVCFHMQVAKLVDTKVNASLSTCVNYLFKIHNIALKEIWGVTQEDIDNCNYYINKEGQCYDKNNTFTLPKIKGVVGVAAGADQLGNQPPASQEPSKGRELPSELDTEQARIYFNRAVAAGLMSEQYKWLARKAQLGYFCFKTYSQPRPLTALERFFDVKKLSSDITNAALQAKRADVNKWRATQDKEIFFD